jgi:hypothetical protein
VLSALFARKPHLRRALAAQVLPAPKAIGPAARLGIRLGSLRTEEDFRRASGRILAALVRGEVTPAEAARLARSWAMRWARSAPGSSIPHRLRAAKLYARP